MRYRSAIPAPPRRFRKIPNQRQRKCTGDTTAIITTTIIVGTAGITTTIDTTIIVTGTAGKCCDSLAQLSNRLASLRACFDSKNCLESGEISARYP
jgi:hypothetical protein